MGACAGCTESIRVLGLHLRPSTRSCSRPWSSDPAFRSVRRAAASRPARHWPSTGNIRWPLAHGGASLLLRPAARTFQSLCLAGPAGNSLAIGRASRKYPMLTHGPLVAPAVSTRRWLTGRSSWSLQPSVPMLAHGLLVSPALGTLCWLTVKAPAFPITSKGGGSGLQRPVPGAIAKKGPKRRWPLPRVLGLLPFAQRRSYGSSSCQWVASPAPVSLSHAGR